MNNKECQSRFVSAKLVLGLFDAGLFAWDRGIPLTRFITLTVGEEYLKRPDTRPQDILSRYLKLSGEWLAFDGAERAHVAIIENPSSGPMNIHILQHVPPSMLAAIGDFEKGWASAAGMKRKKNWVDFQTVSGIASLQDDGLDYAINLRNLLEYLCKGARKEICDLFNQDHEPQGTVLGKRGGWSESIGKAARDRASYRPGQSRRVRWVVPFRPQLRQMIRDGFKDEA